MNPRGFVVKLLGQRSGNFLVQFFRYGLVSAASLAVDFGVLSLLTEAAGLHYLVSAAASYATGLVVNYVLSVLWVFHSRKLDSRAAEFSIFAGIGIAGLFINQFLMWLGTDVVGFHYLVSRAVSAVVGYTWKFVARKLVLFR